MVEASQSVKVVSQEEIEREVSRRYQILQQESQTLITRVMELEDERKENQLVLESLEKLEDDRRCWRLVNGVLFEKSKLEVVPELLQMINNLTAVVKQLNDALLLKKQESAQLERAYDSIMKQAKARRAEQQDDREVKSGGVLV